jgi:hypothetical protein
VFQQYFSYIMATSFSSGVYLINNVLKNFFFLFPSPPSVQAPAYGHGRTDTEGINGVNTWGVEI